MNRDAASPAAQSAADPGKRLGVLGGMGPAATANFLEALARATPARIDQDHIPTIVYSDPSTPDRSNAILGIGPSPERAMEAGIRFLVQSGCDHIAIPCNSAHYWFESLQRAAGGRILHIADAVVDRLLEMASPGAAVGILATAGTLRSEIFVEALKRSSFVPIVPDADSIARWIMPGIRAVKAGRLAEGSELIAAAAADLRALGADELLIGCTDISVVVKDTAGRWVDANDALAHRCVLAIRGTTADPERVAATSAERMVT